MYKAKAYAAASATSRLRRRRSRGAIQQKTSADRNSILRVCHSDLHAVRNEWSEFMPTVYPIVPGHEIVGRVTEVGAAVTNSRRRPGRSRLPRRLGRHLRQMQAGFENFART